MAELVARPIGKDDYEVIAGEKAVGRIYRLVVGNLLRVPSQPRPIEWPGRNLGGCEGSVPPGVGAALTKARPAGLARR
jgi:hypothetical protein